VASLLSTTDHLSPKSFLLYLPHLSDHPSPPEDRFSCKWIVTTFLFSQDPPPVPTLADRPFVPRTQFYFNPIKIILDFLSLPSLRVLFLSLRIIPYTRRFFPGPQVILNRPHPGLRIFSYFQTFLVVKTTPSCSP